jgi:RNA polymerase sigma factor (TIGR02999 family)
MAVTPFGVAGEPGMGRTAYTTQMLVDLGRGGRGAADRLLPLVYDELRKLAAGHLQGERGSHTLQPTALVHEAYLRMIDQTGVNWENLAHFFAVASEMIRRILVDHARRHQAAKRGGGAAKLEIDESIGSIEARDIDLLALDEAIDELGKLNDRHRQVVELRFFGGLGVKETAHVMAISPETVKSDWRAARAWLRGRLARDTPIPGFRHPIPPRISRCRSGTREVPGHGPRAVRACSPALRGDVRPGSGRA